MIMVIPNKRQSAIVSRGSPQDGEKKDKNQPADKVDKEVLGDAAVGVVEDDELCLVLDDVVVTLVGVWQDGGGGDGAVIEPGGQGDGGGRRQGSHNGGQHRAVVPI